MQLARQPAIVWVGASGGMLVAKIDLLSRAVKRKNQLRRG